MVVSRWRSQLAQRRQALARALARGNTARISRVYSGTTLDLIVGRRIQRKPLAAQDKARTDDSSAEARTVETTPLKISVTFAEFEGDKKVKSLPYPMVVIADERPPKSVLKMGSRVPVYTGKENGMQYLDVGSNLECQAFRTKDNRFDVKLDLDRSWVEGDVPVPVDRGISSQSSSGQLVLSRSSGNFGRHSA